MTSRVLDSIRKDVATLEEKILYLLGETFPPFDTEDQLYRDRAEIAGYAQQLRALYFILELSETLK